ncbi:Acetyl esterase/lipase [Eubacterium ruminantium]|nr:Acetyl esterase/lipase [Eubacterium ruminantium]
MANLSSLRKKSVDEILRDTYKKRNSMGSQTFLGQPQQGMTIKQEEVAGYPCYFIMPENFTGKHLIYLYDSDYAFPVSKDEYDFSVTLARETGMCLCLPMYPLAPDKGCREVFMVLDAVYDHLVHKKKITDVILAGSGVGAGLALSMTLRSWKEGMIIPDKLLLLSPEVDSEFFDKVLENRLLNAYYGDGIFHSENYREFINKYWVGNMAGQLEYTSPINEDMRDLCDHLIIISGTEDIYNCYARELADKTVNAGLHVSYFEFPRMHHKFFHDKDLDETNHATLAIADLLTDSRNRIIDQYMYEIKERGEWSKRYPEIFKDNEATKYLVNNNISYKKYKKQSEFINLSRAATCRCFDEEVRKFILQYPMSTVVYLGCSLDAMFKRMDNGRVNWYNLDSPGKISIRRLYTTDSEREHTIVKSIDDMSWLDDIRCDIGFGLLFVCRDFFQYKTAAEVSKFLEKIYKKFQGAQVVFNAPSLGGKVAKNIYNRKNDVDYKKYRLYLNDPVRDISLWNVAYSVIHEDNIFKNISASKSWNKRTRLRFFYNAKINGERIIRLRLGTERYRIYRDGHLIRV